MRRIESERDIEEGLKALSATEPKFGHLAKRVGLPPLRRAPGGVPGLLRIVMDQQISLKAGAAIWARLEARYAPFEAAILAEATEDDLRACGLSNAKLRTLRSLARAVHAGELDFERLELMSDADAAAALTALPGIGPWTADIYLLTCLGRADAWPKGDLALQAGAQLLLGLPERPNEKAMTALAEPWRPWRAVAARLIWAHYREVKGMAQAV